MNATLDVPLMEDAMTAERLAEWTRDLRMAVGPQASVHPTISDCRYDKKSPIEIGIYTDGHMHERHCFKGNTWSDAFTAAFAWAATYQTIAHDGLIRRMALAIIDLTDQHGECLAVHLRGRHFTADDIAGYSVAACQRASEMSAMAPFEVKP